MPPWFKPICPHVASRGYHKKRVALSAGNVNSTYIPREYDMAEMIINLREAAIEAGYEHPNSITRIMRQRKGFPTAFNTHKGLRFFRSEVAEWSRLLRENPVRKGRRPVVSKVAAS